MSLFEILEISQKTSEEDEQVLPRILAEKPFAKEFYQEFKGERFDWEKLEKNDLIAAMETASYLGISSKKLLDEFLWKLSAKEFSKYFTIIDIRCKPTENLPKIVELELSLHYGSKLYYRCAELSYKNSNTDEAIRTGNLRLLIYLEAHGKKICENAEYNAVMNNQVKILEYLYYIDHIKSKFLMETAAKYGSMDCLKFLHEKNFPKTETVTFHAAQKSFEMLKFAVEIGCPMSPFACYGAAMKGLLECFIYAHKNGSELNEIAMKFAASNIDMLKYAHENKGYFDSSIVAEATRQGNLVCLKFLHENGYEWDSGTCASAASSSLECLKYAHENGCEWDDLTCFEAASNDRLDCLKYAHENGCEWDENVCIIAARQGNLECLRYAHENGCEWNYKAYQTDDRLCLAYLKAHNCPKN